VALGDVDAINGATNLALGSHTSPPGRYPTQDEIVQPELRPGDALLFRGDVIHGGGANRSDRPRRAVSLSYCAGWLRPVENSFLNVPPDRAARLPHEVRRLLGYATHDASVQGGGLVGLYENGHPAQALPGPT
jgi:ectoine hydroxylase-related dioxygenase (phytanoyl-CoA dioxygenase family)